MRYELITEKEPYAVILRGCQLQQYAVVRGLDKEKGEWDWTCCYYDFGVHTELTREKALFKALDDFFARTDERHIPYDRILEIAVLLKDGLVEDGMDEAYEYVRNTVELSENEADMLGLNMEEYRERSDSEDHYTPSSTCGDYGPSHPWDAPGMSIEDFI